MAITRFRGEYFYLSNMYPLVNWIESEQGLFVPTSEHHYMVGRLVSPFLQREVALARGNPDDDRVYKDGLAAKNLAHRFIEEGAIQLENWQLACLGLMSEGVTKKFDANLDIAQKLYDTGDEEIIEGNTWGDRFWGVDPPGSGNGLNHLGKILMNVRANLDI